MNRSSLRTPYLIQAGASLIEVLVAMTLLSFGMLSLAAMTSFAVQMPKLSGYRATAVNLAADYIDRMRANPTGFGNGGYDKPSSYDSSHIALAMDESDACSYPACNATSISTMDNAVTKIAARAGLPAGGVLMSRDSNAGTASITEGNLWIMWQEPDARARLNAATSDNCPVDVANSHAGSKPRCLYVRFKL